MTCQELPFTQLFVPFSYLLHFRSMASRRSPEAGPLRRAILLALAGGPAPTISALAVSLDAQRPSVSRSLKVLRVEGLVEPDGRSWALTEAGRIDAARVRGQVEPAAAREVQQLARVREQRKRLERAMSATAAPVPQTRQSIPLLEQRALSFHEQSVKDAADIWSEGLDVLLRGFDALQGYRIGNQSERRVQVGAFIRAYNWMYRAEQEALRGYYVPSLNLMRAPLEDGMTYWYLRAFPGEHERFTRRPGSESKKNAPRWNVMLQRVEEKHHPEWVQAGKPAPRPEQWVQDWMDQLHTFSHVTNLSVALGFEVDDTNTSYHLGPQHDEGLFRFCTYQAVRLLVYLQEALENLRLLTIGERLAGRDTYRDRARKWQAAEAARGGCVHDLCAAPPCGRSRPNQPDQLR
jgi:DNA-binding transcriptional ArsR family regulator